MTKKFNGPKLKELRDVAIKTLEEVAADIEVDVSSLSLWENGHRRPGPKNLRKILRYYKVPASSLFLALALLFIAAPARAQVADSDAIRAIVGEAANQGFDGMTAVGEVIRHRGSVRGLYGFKAMEHRQESAKVWVLATRAWERSATSNVAHGATLFENIKRFGFPKSWDRGKVLAVAEIGDHVFFTEK